MKLRTLAVPVVLTVAVLGGGLAVTGPAAAGAPAADGQARPGSYTLAVYGDAPYGTSPTDTAEFRATPAFVDSVNADPDVSAVVHVGDIHSGKQYCTEAYDRSVYDLWTRFQDPLVYTPGDNEWTDCHKKAEGGGSYDPATGTIRYVTDSQGKQVDYAGGDPVANLDLVRSIFFVTPGRTLGGGNLHVVSQARAYDPAHPQDKAYVENVRWVRHGVEFVTVNIPGGSNNDADPWYGTPTATSAQTTEAALRTAADRRWLAASFAAAQSDGTRAVVVIEQADMWDVDGKSPAHLTDDEPIIANLAAGATAFGGPVLLLDGDSHQYRSDDPLQAGSACTGEPGVCADDAWSSHPYYDVPNVHRITVHGSTFPLEWLKLTVSPDGTTPAGPESFGPFSWTRMPQPTA